jgi:hypothetical protein
MRVSLAWQAGRNSGFSCLTSLAPMVRDSRQRFLEAWNEFFGIVGE